MRRLHPRFLALLVAGFVPTVALAQAKDPATPASPAPNRNRTATSDRKPVQAAVSAVNADHTHTIQVSTRRVPHRSPSRPTGTPRSP